MFKGYDNRTHVGFGCGFGEHLSCNYSILVFLSVKWAQTLGSLVVERCADDGVVCNNLLISFHLQMSQACDF